MPSSDWISLAGGLISLIGVGVIWIQTEKLSEQLLMQHFSDYTKRYQEIILQFPEDINKKEFVLRGRDDYEKTMRHMRAYIDLCYEEWYLNRRGLIDPEIWRIWEAGVQTAFSKPAFKQAWEIVKSDSNFGKQFEAFIEKCIQ